MPARNRGGCEELARIVENTDFYEPAKVKANMEQRLRWISQGCDAATATKAFGYVETCNLKQTYQAKVAELTGRMAKGIERPDDHLAEMTKLAKAKGLDLRGMDFTNKRMRGIDLQGAKLDNANFTGANLGKANLAKASLKGAIFDRTKLDSTNLRETQLEGASFKQLVLEGVDLTLAQMTSVVFDGVTFDGVSLSSAKAPLSRFVNTTFTGAFSAVLLVDVTLANVTFKKAKLEGWHFERAALTDVKFLESEMTDLHLARSKVAGITFKKSSWQGGLTGSEVNQIVIEDSQIPSASFSSCVVKGGRVTASTASMSFIDFTKLLDVSFCNCPGCQVRFGPNAGYEATRERKQTLCLDTAIR